MRPHTGHATSAAMQTHTHFGEHRDAVSCCDVVVALVRTLISIQFRPKASFSSRASFCLKHQCNQQLTFLNHLNDLNILCIVFARARPRVCEQQICVCFSIHVPRSHMTPSPPPSSPLRLFLNIPCAEGSLRGLSLPARVCACVCARVVFVCVCVCRLWRVSLFLCLSVLSSFFPASYIKTELWFLQP